MRKNKSLPDAKTFIFLSLGTYASALVVASSIITQVFGAHFCQNAFLPVRQDFFDVSFGMQYCDDFKRNCRTIDDQEFVWESAIEENWQFCQILSAMS